MSVKRVLDDVGAIFLLPGWRGHESFGVALGEVGEEVFEYVAVKVVAGIV
jgi:hypothetical protein